MRDLDTVPKNDEKLVCYATGHNFSLPCLTKTSDTSLDRKLNALRNNMIVNMIERSDSEMTTPKQVSEIFDFSFLRRYPTKLSFPPRGFKNTWKPYVSSLNWYITLLCSCLPPRETLTGIRNVHTLSRIWWPAAFQCIGCVPRYCTWIFSAFMFATFF